MKNVVFYISAASDLELEREVLGRAASEVPVDVGWRVVQSPAGNGPVDLEAISPLMESISRAIKPRAIKIPQLSNAALEALAMPLLAIVGGRDRH